MKAILRNQAYAWFKKSVRIIHSIQIMNNISDSVCTKPGYSYV